MANSLSPTMQNSKIEVLEWLANEQDESFVQEIVSFIKKIITVAINCITLNLFCIIKKIDI